MNSTAAVSATGDITINDTCPGGTTVLLGTITLGSSTSATPGAGTLVISSWPCLGGNSLQASYGGDANYSSGVSQPVLETILSQYTATSTNLASTANPSTVGQSVTLAATLTFTLTRTTYPTGIVTFKDTNTGIVLGTANVQTSGTGSEIVTIASIATSTLATGSYAIQAAYSGDNLYAPSTSQTLNQVVQQITTSPTATALQTVGPAEIVVGQSITFKATVTSIGGIPGGALNFNDGANLLATVNLDAAGSASFTTAVLAVGQHAITADYGGSAAFAPSTSTPVNALVQAANLSSTTTTLNSSANPAAPGVSTALAATVAPVPPSAGTPTGTVTFADGSTTLGSVSLTNGVAGLNYVFAVNGSHPLTASYTGDATFAASLGTLTEVVSSLTLPATTTAISSSANPSVFGQAVTFTATVTRTAASGVPTGEITFSVGSISSTVLLNNMGVATFTTGALPVGNFSVTAAYAGDSNNGGSISPVLAQEVAQAAVNITNGCIFSLDRSAKNAMVVSGSSKVTSGCGVWVNSNSPQALQVTGGASLAVQGGSISLVGGDTGSNPNISPKPVSIAAFTDPLWYLPVPSWSTCDYPNQVKVNKSTTLYPGVYCGGINIGGGTVTLGSVCPGTSGCSAGPGVYILNGGGLTIAGKNTSVSGNGVLFYNTGDSTHPFKPINVKDALLTLSAPVSGDYASVLVFEDRKQGGPSIQNTFSGAINGSVSGVLYFLNSHLAYSGGSSTNPQSAGIVADILTFPASAFFK